MIRCNLNPDFVQEKKLFSRGKGTALKIPALRPNTFVNQTSSLSTLLFAGDQSLSM